MRNNKTRRRSSDLGYDLEPVGERVCESSHPDGAAVRLALLLVAIRWRQVGELVVVVFEQLHLEQLADHVTACEGATERLRKSGGR